MDEKLEMLVRLQKLDSAIDSLERRLEKFPSEKALLEDELQSSETSLHEVVSRKEEIEKEQRHFERELQAENDNLLKHNDRLLSIKDNEQYQAVLKEIEQLKAKIGDYEGEILDRMTTLDDVSEELTTQEAAFEVRKRETAEMVESLEVDMSRVRDKLKIRKLEREELVKSIEVRTLKTYEKIRAKKRGVAVVAVQKEACGGCFERLPPQRINEIRMNLDMIYCENCGSILVWDEAGVLNNHSTK